MQTNGLLGFWRGMSKWQRACALSNIPLFALHCLSHPAPAPPLPPPLSPPMVAASPPAPAPPSLAVLEARLPFSDPFRRPLSRTGGADARRSRPGYRAPEPLPSNPEVVLPFAFLREQFDDTVELRATIDAEGSVQGVRVLRSSGSNAVDVAAADTVRRWRYRPAQRNGRPVAAIEEMMLSVGDTFGE